MPKQLKNIKRWPWDYLLIFSVLIFYYAWLQWNNYIGDPDGFYHAKLTVLLRQGQLLKTLPWMQASSLTEHFTDHHLLYHLLLIPFSFIKTPLIGIKVATVVFTATAGTVFYWLLKRMHLAYPWIFALLFITMEGSNFRLTLVKANALSLVLIWLLVYALFSHRKYLTGLLGFIFVWLYGGWPLAILIFLIWLVADKGYDYLHTSKLKIFANRTLHILKHKKIQHKNLKLGAWLMGGLIAGLILNPYWPHNLNFYYQQVVQIGIINQSNSFPVGGEWYGTTIMHLLSSTPHLFVLATIIFLTLFFNIKKVSRLSFFSFLLAFAFMLLAIKSRRYVEYFFPFLLLFVASGFSDVKKIINFSKLKKLWQQAPNYLRFYWIIVVMVFATLIMPAIYNKTLNTEMSKRWKIDSFQTASAWLAKNTPDESVVFHSDWDEWPALFYYNDHNYYIIGLDPTFMENYDSELHTLFRKITTGQVKRSVSQQIKYNFNANYVFIQKEGHDQFIENLDDDPRAMVVYNDEETTIYQIE